MTGIVRGAGLLRRRTAAWVAVGVALALAPRAGAEPLVSRFGNGAGTGFAVAADSPILAPPRPTARRPRTSKLQELRALLLREHGVEAMTLFFGYFGAFIPPPVATDPTPPPVVLSDSSPPPMQMPPSPPPLQMPASMPGWMPPPSSAPPSQTPEPATLVTGLLGAGLAGLASWRKRRRKKLQEA